MPLTLVRFVGRSVPVSLGVLVVLATALTQPTGAIASQKAVNPGAPATLTAAAPTDRALPKGFDGIWTQYDGDGRISVRAVKRGGSCPTIRLRGVPNRPNLKMKVRARPMGTGLGAFDDLVCDAQLPNTTNHASVAGKRLRLPTKNPTRLVILGDTGCRLKEGRPAQECNDPSKWPFAKIAMRAAAENPQLVIHMGDEHYRESPCPSGNQGCEGAAWGYNSVSNREDFFNPARPLLAAAPWVFVRGDHEGCTRNGLGWFRYWNARGNRSPCSEYTQPFTVPIGKRSLLVFDDSFAEEKDPIDTGSAQQKIYKDQLRELFRRNPGPSWFATHKPVWGIKPAEPPKTFERTNPAMQTALNNRFPANVSLSLAGDLHLFEAFTFATQRVPQLVIGNGGDLLVSGPQPTLPGLALGASTILSGRIIQDFGYTVWDRQPAGWRVTLKDQNGGVVFVCQVNNDATTTCS